MKIQLFNIQVEKDACTFEEEDQLKIKRARPRRAKSNNDLRREILNKPDDHKAQNENNKKLISVTK
jgi:hypothetical protein